MSQVSMARHTPSGQLVAIKHTNLDECTEEELLQLSVSAMSFLLIAADLPTSANFLHKQQRYGFWVGFILFCPLVVPNK